MKLASPEPDDEALDLANDQVGQKLVRRMSFSLANVFWFATFVVLVLGLLLLVRQNRNARQEISWLEQQLDRDSVVQIDYDWITLFRMNQEVYALRLFPAANGAEDKVNYEWIKVPANNESDGNATWTEVFDRQIDKNRGSGSLEETNNRTQLEIGPITIQWSRGGPNYGWLYLSEVRQLDSRRLTTIEIYRSPIVSLDQITQITQVHSRLWKSWTQRSN
jgi:hypothetical protein